MLHSTPNPDQGFDRYARLEEMRQALLPEMPHLSRSVVDLGRIDLFCINPDLKGRRNAVWLVDGEVSAPIVMNELRHVPGNTFAVQLEIIPWERDGSHLCAWNVLRLIVANDYNPQSIVREIRSFTKSFDAALTAQFLAEAIDNPHSYDMRLRRATSLTEYYGVLDRIENRAIAFSIHRQLAQLKQYFTGEEN